MTLAQTRMACWPGAALVLCLLVGLLGFSGPVFAHGGHSHDRVAVTKAAHVKDTAQPNQVAAANGVATVDVIPTERAVPIAALPERIAAHQYVVKIRDHAASGLGLSPVETTAGTERMICSCGTGCGSCTSASCCSGAVIPPALDWSVPTAALVAELAPGESALGLSSSPLPRPPNPVRLS